MIHLSGKSREEIVAQLPKNFLVLDVGGAGAPFLRADYVMDILPFEEVHWDQARDRGTPRFDKSTYVQRDICSREPWPFKDKMFDYVICAHVLEDIRDPIWVLDEILRVGKAGYIEVPSRLYETSYGTEGKSVTGASHHRWIVDVVDDALRFTFKLSWVHLPFVAKKQPPQGDARFLRLEWKENLKYKEQVLNNGEEQCEYLLGKSDARTMHHFFRKLLGTNYFLAELKYWYRKNARFRTFVQKVTGRRELCEGVLNS
jgi:SAM-dependent methyltransferase